MRPVQHLATCSRRVMVMAAASVGLLLMALGVATPAFAIPSPELIVGSFTSISQLIALLSAMLGGGAALVGIRASAKPDTSRRAWQIAIGAIACLFVSLAFNFYQYSRAQNERQSRLEATLTRPTPTINGRALDPTLKEVSYKDQLSSSRGIGTDEAERLLEATQRGERDDIIFLDIREPAEGELGSLPGAKAIRFPDLARTNLNLSGKRAILLCHNGNRSYETCAALAAKGIDCRFMVGGLEKWLVEQRSLTGMKARTLADLRALPSYRNQAVLLDTEDVHRLVQEDGAIFVDVRYPGEFASNHLPGAINLSIRPTPSDELQERISKLPRQPIVAPCYDRRSCFFAELLGLELDRAGYDFRGRYTVPWEYFTASTPRPYIEQWLQEAQRSWWDKLVTLLAELVRATAQHIGFPITILLLAIASRLFVLPLSLKAERDQIRSRAASDELQAIKLRLKHDPVQRTRAIRALYVRLGLTPVRNLLALLFLPIMAVALSAVQEAVFTEGGGRFLWIPELGERDSLLILPILFGALLAIYLEVAFARSLTHRIAVWAIAFPLLVATGALFTAAADLYLVASAALLLLQRIAVVGELAGVAALWRRFRLGRGVISLDEPHQLSPYGNKAYRLAQMRSQGLPVPDGVLLTPSFLKDFACGSMEWRRHRLDRIWQWLGSARVVVRSSAIAEDSGKYSFAGVFESVLNVDREGLDAAIANVMASFSAGRAGSYVVSGGSGSVLIQRMIEAEYAGVLFTRDPSAGGLAMVEMVRGTAEDLVSGAVRPATYRLGSVSGMPIGELDPPLDLKALHALGRRAERLFGVPQDLEWTYHTGRFYLVQSRDITRVIVDESDAGLVRREMARALDLADGLEAGAVAFGKNEFAEMLPRPTPLSLSLMEALWQSGGSVDLASRKLGLSYQVTDRSADYFVSILGRLYVNRREERVRVLKVGAWAARRLKRNAKRIEQEFRESFLPRFLAEIRLMEVADFDKLSTTELLDEIARLRDGFVLGTHVEVDVINIATNFYLEGARRELNAHHMDASTFLSHIPETDEARALAEMTVVPAESRRAVLLATMGHRAVLDYELSEPRYSEVPSALDPVTSFRSVDCSSHVEESEPDSAGPGKSLKKSIEIARRFQALKEDAKHHSLRELAVLRQAILALDRRLQLGGLSFFLRFDELLDLRERPVNELREVATRRQEDRARMIEMAPLTSTLLVRDLEAISAGGDAVHHEGGDLIRGTRVSGRGTAEGRARIVSDADAERGDPIKNFEDGDIIVASMVHPSWLPYFPRAGGFICEIGGWLSHTAILAREYEVPMIVNTSGMAAIKDRSLLRLRPDGLIEVMEAPDFVRVAAE
jgi:rifampicin phosphotransferase